METTGTPAGTSGAELRAAAGRPSIAAAARRLIHVHATPSAAVAGMDDRRRALEGWFAELQRRSGTGSEEKG